MDEFDVIDAVYDVVEAAETGLVIYKDRSKTGEKADHIVISNMQFNEFDYVNKVPVNVNIFITLQSNGMLERVKMRTVKRDVRAALLTIRTKNGQHINPDIEWSTRISGAKEGFDCMNIRVLISTDKQ